MATPRLAFDDVEPLMALFLEVACHIDAAFEALKDRREMNECLNEAMQ